MLFVEPTPSQPVAFAWDAEELDAGDLPSFVADSDEPRVRWVTFACSLETLGLDGPLELGSASGAVHVPSPVRQVRLAGRSWEPAADVRELLSRLPADRTDFCRAQASSVATTALRLTASAPTEATGDEAAWTAPLDDHTVLTVRTGWPEDEDAALDEGSSDAFVATLDLLRDIAAGRAPTDAAHVPSLTATSTATGVFAVDDAAGGPSGSVLWVDLGVVRWLEIDASRAPPALPRGRWTHPTLRTADRIYVSAREAEAGLEALVLAASTRHPNRNLSTLLSIREGRLETLIPTATIAADIPFDLVALPDGDALVRGAAPGLVEGDRLLRVSAGELVPSAVERLPPGASTCRIRRVDDLEGRQLYVSSGPGCRGNWYVRSEDDRPATWAPAASSPSLADASARRAGARFTISRASLYETRAGVGRCPIETPGALDASAGSWAPGSAPDAWVLFAHSAGAELEVELVEVTEPGPGCEVRPRDE